MPDPMPRPQLSYNLLSYINELKKSFPVRNISETLAQSLFKTYFFPHNQKFAAELFVTLAEKFPEEVPQIAVRIGAFQHPNIDPQTGIFHFSKEKWTLLLVKATAANEKLKCLIDLASEFVPQLLTQVDETAKIANPGALQLYKEKQILDIKPSNANFYKKDDAIPEPFKELCHKLGSTQFEDAGQGEEEESFGI